MKASTFKTVDSPLHEPLESLQIRTDRFRYPYCEKEIVQNRRRDVGVGTNAQRLNVSCDDREVVPIFMSRDSCESLFHN